LRDKKAMNKQLLSIDNNAKAHWVGDGFPVRTLFSHHTHGAAISPFLMLDYAGPAEFPPSDNPRGVEEHPHKGFETVTIVYSGEVEHRDSAGGGGSIGPGDVQWMTAASGLVHEEKHGREFTERGGVLEMVQLWVNLPAKDKAAKPRYQSITAEQIPSVELPDGLGSVRVIAGEFQSARGPAKTFTAMNVWDGQLRAGSLSLPIPDGHNAILLVMDGKIGVGDGKHVGDAGLATFSRQGGAIELDVQEPTRVLVLSGEPIEEPVAAYGPFVMNTQEEIRQAYDDYRHGRMGSLSK
jgi:redox-sensitive bicupin YhaK (pirin superfamily)